MLLLCTNIIQLLSPLSFFQHDHSSVTSAISHPRLAGFMHSRTVACHWTVSASKLLLQRVKFALGLKNRLRSVYQFIKSTLLTCSLCISFLGWIVIKKKKRKKKCVSISANCFLSSPSSSVNCSLTFPVKIAAVKRLRPSDGPLCYFLAGMSCKKTKTWSNVMRNKHKPFVPDFSPTDKEAEILHTCLS